MDIRPLDPEDLPVLLDLTTAVFGPFYEDFFRPLVGEAVFVNRHGNWKDDYRRHLAGLHAPDKGKFAAVARTDGQMAGFVGWVIQKAERHGEIDILAVAPSYRRLGVGRALAEHSMAHMRAAGADVISIGTGGDDFHAPARELYESLGFTPFPNVSYTKAV
ncbi:GNAT family N-acetyltransferase [Actinosynnema sp. ALI-1.44]|uniref:GNAT family N-acetyltransferase n=1 Tax=Actinosynnema sp. ALI-1.44 TaxID=1933779 RepID=UPI00097C2D6A|nr:GNAT family N-acetyltransferase [Actinosynnema sp. ALI-1.44]ONI83182.1 GNAT family N-acetyltransferase [Actinosynnema sp. ALI-1.44]